MGVMAAKLLPFVTKTEREHREVINDNKICRPTTIGFAGPLTATLSVRDCPFPLGGQVWSRTRRYGG
jgi:hypothetical protein